MTSFSQISTIISMILGLGVTRMLLGLISVFRSRRRARIDWLPLAWAAIIFLTQMQYWWAVSHIPATFPGWSFENFLALTAFTGLLFVSGALLLPAADPAEAQDLRTFFESEGRWSLLFLALYFLLTLAVNAFYFQVPVLEVWALLNIVAMLLPLTVFTSRSRGLQAATTLIAIPFNVLNLIALTDDAFILFVQHPLAR